VPLSAWYSTKVQVPEPETVMVEVAVKPPSVVRTVIVAVPAATPVTRPVEADRGSRSVAGSPCNRLVVAFEGNTVAVSCWVAPTLTDAVVGATVTPVTGTLTVDL